MTDAKLPPLRLAVAGLRSLQDVRLDLGPVTVLIGPNGAGKSNLLTALRLLSALTGGNLRRFVQQSGGANALLHYGAKTTPYLHLQLSQPELGRHYEVRLAHVPGDRLVIDEEYATSTGTPSQPLLIGRASEESQLPGLVQSPDLDRTLYDMLRHLGAAHFHDTSPRAALRQSARAVQDRALLPDGANLAAFLYRLRHSPQSTDQSAWRRINLLVRRVAPSVHSLDPVALDPGDEPPRYIRLQWTDDRGETFGVEDLSDGTLRAIALISTLAQPLATLPPLLTLGEPELGLHPAAIGLLAGLIRAASAHCRVLIATQSPTLLDLFDPAEVVVVERTASATTLRRLDASSLKAWLEEYSLSALFEKNILGGRP